MENIIGINWNTTRDYGVILAMISGRVTCIATAIEGNRLTVDYISAVKNYNADKVTLLSDGETLDLNPRGWLDIDWFEESLNHAQLDAIYRVLDTQYLPIDLLHESEYRFRGSKVTFAIYTDKAGNLWAETFGGIRPIRKIFIQDESFKTIQFYAGQNHINFCDVIF